MTGRPVRCPGRCRAAPAGAPICCMALSMAVTAWPSAVPGARLKESVTAGNWPWWFTASGETCVVPIFTKVESGTAWPVGALDVELLQGCEIALHVGRDFEDQVVGIHLGEVLRDLALAEGVVERGVDHGGLDAEAGGGIAVDGERRRRARHLLVGADVAELRHLAAVSPGSWAPSYRARTCRRPAACTGIASSKVAHRRGCPAPACR